MSTDLILDVGCGSNPHGDVNIDAHPNNKNQCWEEWNPKNVKNFILTDAHKLPFRKEVFSKVLCIHTLEHLQNPLAALNEMKYIVNGTLDLRVPSEYNTDKTKTHLYTWNPDTLKNLLEKVFNYVETGYTSRTDILRRSHPIQRLFPLTNQILSKIGLRPEIYAHIQILRI